MTPVTVRREGGGRRICWIEGFGGRKWRDGE